MSVFAPQSRLARDSSREVSSHLWGGDGGTPGALEVHSSNAAGAHSSQQSQQQGQEGSTAAEGAHSQGAGVSGSETAARVTALSKGSGDIHSPGRNPHTLHTFEVPAKAGGWKGEDDSSGVAAAQTSEDDQSKGMDGSRGSPHAVTANQDKDVEGAAQRWQASHNTQGHSSPYLGGQEASSGIASAGEVGSHGARESRDEANGGSGGQLESFASALDYVLDHLQDLDPSSPRRQPPDTHTPHALQKSYKFFSMMHIKFGVRNYLTDLYKRSPWTYFPPLHYYDLCLECVFCMPAVPSFIAHCTEASCTGSW